MRPRALVAGAPATMNGTPASRKAAMIAAALDLGGDCGFVADARFRGHPGMGEPEG